MGRNTRIRTTMTAANANKTTKPRLYSRAVFTGFRRGKRTQYTDTSILKIEGVQSREDTEFYMGKRAVLIYKAPKQEKQGSKFRTIRGRVTQPHGNAGSVRAKFNTNLPPAAMGTRGRVMLYPS